MTREIKFRGKSAGEWYYGHLFAYRNKGGSIGAHFIVMQETEDAKPKPIQVMPETVGQFTGLHDKNGKEIYEGDIVCFHLRFRLIQEAAYQVGIIIYEGGKFYSQLTKSSEIELGGEPDDYEVIGNTTDNPELLKGGKS